jgi:sugar phosphate permease
MVQATVLSYLPLYTIQALGFDTIGAGLLVACSQAGGAVSRLALGAASDRWLADRRSVWLAVTGAIGAASFVSYAVWQVSAPLAAAGLTFTTGIGAYGWVGIFFRDQRRARRVANGRTAERHGVRVDRGRAARGPATFGLLLVRWDSYAAPWTAFAVLSAIAAGATLVISSAIERERR